MLHIETEAKHPHPHDVMDFAQPRPHDNCLLPIGLVHISLAPGWQHSLIEDGSEESGDPFI